MNIIINWLISALAVLIAAYILPGVTVSSFFVALVVAVVLAAINLLIKPIILILTLPINIITLGLFTFVINALLVLLAAKIVTGFTVSGFWYALLFAIVLSLVSSVFGQFNRKA